MNGPFPLNVLEINRRADDLRPGVYTVGSYEGGVFRVKCVGRFSANMSGTLYRWLGLHTHFQYKLLPSSRAAFAEECRLWHAYGGEEHLPDSAPHPQGPHGQQLECPVCGRLV